MSAQPETTNEHIVIERQGRVQVIRFNRPDKKNAFTRAMYAAMTIALNAAEGDDTIGAHVFLGTPGAFSAGNDMQDFLAYAMGGELGREILDFLDRISTLEKPAVSGVDGLAIGIGTTLNMHCDLTFATPGSLFRTPFVDLALVPEAGSSLLAPRIMGHQRAFAMLAMGEGFSADEARDAGLIWKVVDADALDATVLQTAEALAAKPPQAMRIAKQLMKGEDISLADRMKEEVKHFGAQLRSEEAKAAFMAFMARKKG